MTCEVSSDGGAGSTTVRRPSFPSLDPPSATFLNASFPPPRPSPPRSPKTSLPRPFPAAAATHEETLLRLVSANYPTSEKFEKFAGWRNDSIPSITGFSNLNVVFLGQASCDRVTSGDRTFHSCGPSVGTFTFSSARLKTQPSLDSSGK